LNDKDSPWYPLLKEIDHGRNYQLQVLSNPEGLAWGSPIVGAFNVPKKR